MNGDLIAEKEYKDMANGGVKTWQWLKNLFRGGKEMSDDEFIETLVKEAKEKELEIDKNIEQDRFSQEMLETAKIVENEENKEFQKDMLKTAHIAENQQNIAPNLANANENVKENTKGAEKQGESGESNENDGFANDFLGEANENSKLAKNFNAKGAQGNENANESAESSANNENDGKDSKEKAKILGESQENEQTLGYFSRKKEEIDVNKEMKNKPQSKESFKEELLLYAEKKMSADEMRVMVSLLHSNNKKITKEHKLLIQNCLDVTQKNNPNFNYLSAGHKAIIRASNNQRLGTQSIKEFIALANNPKDKLDASIIKNCKESCVKNILKNTKDLPQATITKLTALVNPALAKTMEAGINAGRTMAK